MAQCIALGCRNRKAMKKPGISFHTFPRDKDLRKSWVKALRRDFVPTDYSLVCSVHFKEEDFDRSSPFVTKLKKGVIPSIFSVLPEETKNTKAYASPIPEEVIQVKCDPGGDHDDTSNTEDNDLPFNLPLEPVIIISNENNHLKNSVSKQKGIFQAIDELKRLYKSVNKDQAEVVSSSNNSENQFDIFGRCVAAQLKSIPFDRALMAQSRIQDILSQYAIECYRDRNQVNSNEEEQM